MRVTVWIIALGMACGMIASPAAAQGKVSTAPPEKTWSGYLVDNNCGLAIAKKEKSKAMDMGKRHSVACALDEVCMASGYGIIHEGTYIKLDSAGDKKAVKYLQSLNKKNDVFVTVSGTLEGSILRVSKITDGVAPDVGKDKKN
jgi:hypothetical protein